MFTLKDVWNWLPIHKWDGADDSPARPGVSNSPLFSEFLGDPDQASLTEQPTNDESDPIILKLQAECDVLFGRYEAVSRQLNLTLLQLNCVQEELEKCHSLLIAATELAEAQHHQIDRASELIAALLSEPLRGPLVEQVQVEILPPIEVPQLEQYKNDSFGGLARMVGAIRASLRRPH